VAVLGPKQLAAGGPRPGFTDHARMEIPACYRCRAPGQVPVRKHGVALCLACYREALAVTVGTDAEPVPA
jgi:hypothetical protein